MRYDDEFDRPEPYRRWGAILFGALLLAGLAIAGWYSLLYQPLEGRIADGEAELAAIRAERASQRDPRGRIASTDRALLDLCRRRMDRQRELPAEAGAEELHDSLNDLALRAGVTPGESQVLETLHGSDFSVVPVAMSFRATERELRVLIGLIGILPRVVTVSDMQWQPVAEVVESAADERRRRRRERRMREDGQTIPPPGPPEFDVSWVVNGYFAGDSQRAIPEPCSEYRQQLAVYAAEQQAAADAAAAAAAEAAAEREAGDRETGANDPADPSVVDDEAPE